MTPLAGDAYDHDGLFAIEFFVEFLMRGVVEIAFVNHAHSVAHFYFYYLIQLVM